MVNSFVQKRILQLNCWKLDTLQKHLCLHNPPPFFNLAVNELITDKIQNIFPLIAEHTGFVKYSLNKIDEVI